MQLGLCVSIEEIFISVTAISASYFEHSYFGELRSVRSLYASRVQLSHAPDLLALLEEPVPFHSSELWMVGIWQHHMKWRGRLLAAAIAKQLVEEALLEWRHQNSGRVRVYNFGSCCIKVVRASSVLKLFCNTTVENTTDRFNIGHHRISSKFEAGKRSLCYIFIACATGIADNNGNVAQVSRMANSWFNTHLHCTHNRKGINAAVAGDVEVFPSNADMVILSKTTSEERGNNSGIS